MQPPISGESRKSEMTKNAHPMAPDLAAGMIQYLNEANSGYRTGEQNGESRLFTQAKSSITESRKQPAKERTSNWEGLRRPSTSTHPSFASCSG
jgi:hypothetical protein